MAKYFITLVLLAFLALENNTILRRIHAKSHGGEELNTMQHYMHHNQPHHNQRPHHHKHRTHRQAYHHSRPPHSEEDYAQSSEDDEAKAALLRYIHLQRHFEHQQQHQQQHKQHERHNNAAPNDEGAKTTPNIRTMPRLWQHLQAEEERKHEDRMYGDAPAEDSGEAHMRQSLEAELPPVEDSLESAPSNSLDYDESSENSEEGGHRLSTAGMRCPKCKSERKVEHISEEQLTQLRIEFVKQQILEKLRLKERPNVSAVGLPKPIYEGTTIEEDEEHSKGKDLDDYYARTSKKFIFLQREKRECQRLGVHPSMCFSFKIDDADAVGFDVSTAVLWIFKNKQNKLAQRNNTILEQQTIVVSEVHQQLDSKYIPIVKTIAIQSVDVQDEWMKIDIEWPIKRWFGNHDLSHLIHIKCQSCDISSMDEMISVDKDYRPFIMVDTQNRRRASRQKRGINCTDGVTECCREKLYISFDEIGWGDWIIQPRGYDAYFCRGSCGSIASVAQATSHHSSVMQKLLANNRRHGRKPLELIPCCTAKQYSSLQLVFMDSNNTATQMTFPNMVVESCGCR